VCLGQTSRPWRAYTGEHPRLHLRKAELAAGAGDRAEAWRGRMLRSLREDRPALLSRLFASVRASEPALVHGLAADFLSDSLTPLMHAGRVGSVRCMRVLRCAGADPDALAPLQNSAAWWLEHAACDSPDAVPSLLEAARSGHVYSTSTVAATLRTAAKRQEFALVS
jgi:hypothetical protein